MIRSDIFKNSGKEWNDQIFNTWENMMKKPTPAETDQADFPRNIGADVTVLLDSLHNSIIAIDTTVRVVFCNDAGEKLIGADILRKGIILTFL
jgi:hypothetical protein